MLSKEALNTNTLAVLAKVVLVVSAVCQSSAFVELGKFSRVDQIFQVSSLEDIMMQK